MRERAFIFLLRRDIADKLSMPSLKREALRPLIPLESFLLPVSHSSVEAEIADFATELALSGLHSSFRPHVLPPPDSKLRLPHCAWTCGAGGFGQRAYVRSIPAIKVFGDGP